MPAHQKGKQHEPSSDAASQGRGKPQGRGGDANHQHQSAHKGRPERTPLPPPQRQPEHLPSQSADESLPGSAAAQQLPPRPLPREPKPYIVGSNPALEEGIRRGTHVVASLKVKKWTSGLAFGTASGWLPRDVALHGFEARGAALPNDIVCVELNPVVSWREVRSHTATLEDHKPAGFGDRSAHVNLNTLSAPSAADRAALPPDAAFEQTVKHGLVAQPARSAEQQPFERIPQQCGATPPADWNPKLQPTGRVVAVLERHFSEYQAARLFGYNTDGGNFRVYPDKFYKFKPYNDQFPIVSVMGTDVPSHFRDDVYEYLLLLEIVRDEASGELETISGMPRARVIMSLGKSGTADAESRAIASMYNVRDFDFPPDVEACVTDDFVVPPPEELKKTGRRDLRKEEFVCTIDPATARDLDDALSIAKTPGGYRVGVHIADVSHFVPLDSPVDLEARARCTSTYFVERVVPMLPRRLCEDHCSLNAGSDKFSFSCIFQFDNNGTLLSEWFGQSVIRNRCRMAYEDAQNIINGDHSGESLTFTDIELQECPREKLVADVVQSVMLLYELAGKLRKRRYDKGALSLNKRKLRFIFEDFNSRLAPKGFVLDQTKEANWLIEEYMLYANIRTATKVVEFLPDCALLRRHDPPHREKIMEMTKAAAKHGLNISGKSSKGLNDSLERYKDHPNSDVLRLMATYCMSLAKYTCSGDDATQPVAHYALATPLYTHFTSPIRRYCDLVVHRQLLLALEIEQLAKSGRHVDREQLRYNAFHIHPADCQEICLRANDRKEAARKAGEASIKMFFCLYLNALRIKAKVDPSISPVHRCKAVITRLKDDKFNVYCPQISMDGEIYHNAKKQRWTGENVVNEDEGTFTVDWGTHQGSEVKEELSLFSEITVTLDVFFFGTITLDMIVDPPWERSATAGILSKFPDEL